MPQNNGPTAQQVKDATDLVKLISDHIEVKPKGSEFVCICPFHDDKNPSMTIVPERQFYKCFACGAGGDVFNFVRDYHKMTFAEAMEFLVTRSGGDASVKQHAGDRPVARKPDPEKMTEDEAGDLYAKFMAGVARKDVGKLAEDLGVSPKSLRRLCIGWDPDKYNAWTFPMSGRRSDYDKGDRKGRDFTARVIGFRIRNDEAKKWAWPGSKAGIFLPTELDLDPSKVLWIAEGPTDTAAMLTFDFNALGRPSCRGQENEIIDAINWIRPCMVAIMSDPDGPGLNGAEFLAGHLRENKMPVKIVSPPISADVRRWVQSGATARDLQNRLDVEPLWRPSQ